jgi:hypothetical protein
MPVPHPTLGDFSRRKRDPMQFWDRTFIYRQVIRAINHAAVLDQFLYIPELDLKWAYPAFWLICILLIIAMLLFFRRRKWF